MFAGGVVYVRPYATITIRELFYQLLNILNSYKFFIMYSTTVITNLSDAVVLCACV